MRPAEQKNFNSIKVRLEQSIERNYRAAQLDFNSIKVRLELNPNLAIAQISGFQFHKGAIRTNDNPATKALSVISIP